MDAEQKKWLEEPRLAFLEWLEHKNYSKRTKKTYEGIFMKLLAFLKNHKLSLEDINKTIFREFISELTDSQKSRKIYATQIFSVFSYLEEIGIIEDNPVLYFYSLSKGRTERKLPVVLSKDEQIRFLKNINDGKTPIGMRENAILMILFETGIRCSEVANLRTGDLVLGENSKIRILGKGGKEREIPISERISDILQEFLEFRPHQSEFVFSNKKGNPPKANTIYMMVRKTMTRSGIMKPKMGPHTLRHTFATRQFEAGVPPAVVKNWMGHSSLVTTLIYEHVSGGNGAVKPV